MFLIKPAGRDSGSNDELKASSLYIREGTKKTKGFAASIGYTLNYGLGIELGINKDYENALNNIEYSGFKVAKVYDIPKEIADLIIASDEAEILKSKVKSLIKDLLR